MFCFCCSSLLLSEYIIISCYKFCPVHSCELVRPCQNLVYKRGVAVGLGNAIISFLSLYTRNHGLQDLAIVFVLRKLLTTIYYLIFIRPPSIFSSKSLREYLFGFGDLVKLSRDEFRSSKKFSLRLHSWLVIFVVHSLLNSATGCCIPDLLFSPVL